MKDKINAYIKKKEKEAILKFLKKHIVGVIALLLVVIGFITLKLLKKTIKLRFRLAIVDSVKKAKDKKNASDDDFDDIEPLGE